MNDRCICCPHPVSSNWRTLCNMKTLNLTSRHRYWWDYVAFRAASEAAFRRLKHPLLQLMRVKALIPIRSTLIPCKWAISFFRTTNGTHWREEILEFRGLGERVLLEVMLFCISYVAMMSLVCVILGKVHDLKLHWGLLRIRCPISRYCARDLAAFNP
jgi:hypothetical protein